MAAFDFPSSPSPLQEYTPDGTDLTYVWNGYAWVVKSGGTNLDDYLPLIGGNMKGNITFGPNGDASKLQITNATGALTAQGTEPLRFVSSKSTDQYKFATPNGSFNASVSSENLTESRTFKFPDQGGTFALSENFPTNIRFLGPIDVTGTAPASPTAGDIYLNDTAGNAGASWTGLNEEFIALNQLVFFTALSDWVAGGVTDASVYVTLGTQQTVTGQKSFTQNVGIGGTLPTSPNIRLSADGSATFAGTVNTTNSGWFQATKDNGNAAYIGASDTELITLYTGASKNVILNANGSATFADTVQVGGDANSGAETGARVFVGGFQATAATPGSGSRSLWDGYALGNTTPTSRIYTDGSASYSGIVQVRTSDNELAQIEPYGVIKLKTNQGAMAAAAAVQISYDGGSDINLNYDGSASFASGKITLDADGSADFADAVDSTRVNLNGTGTSNILVGYADTTPNFILQADGTTTVGNTSGGGNIVLDPDGSATFAGSVQSLTWPTTGYQLEGIGSLGLNAAGGTTGNMFSLLVGGTQVANITGQGNAEFAGNVIIGTADTFSDTANGVRLLSSGTVTSQRQATQGTSSVFTGMLGDTSTITMLADGSATFAGTVKQGTFNGGQTTAMGSVLIDGGGVMTQFEASTTAATNRAFVVYHGGDEQIEFKGDGSGEFTNTVTSPSFYGSGTGTSQVWYGGTTGTSIITADGTAVFDSTLSVLGTYSTTADTRQFTVNNGGVFIKCKSTDTSAYTALNIVKSPGNGGNATTIASITGDGSATFAARVSGEVTTIPDGAWDLADSNLWQTSSGTLVNPSGTEPGQTGVIYANSDINTWGSYFKFPGGDVPTVPANSIIPYYVVTQNVISMGMATEEIG